MLIFIFFYFEQVCKDFKVPERRYTWIKLQTWASTHKWEELKKYVKQKKLPVSASQVVKLVRQHGGQDVAAKQFLSENEDFLSSEEKFTLLTDFGMYVEAAASAFSVKNLEALNNLERMCEGRDRQILQTIANYKSKLINK